MDESGGAHGARCTDSEQFKLWVSNGSSDSEAQIGQSPLIVCGRTLGDDGSVETPHTRPEILAASPHQAYVEAIVSCTWPRISRQPANKAPLDS